MTDQDRLKLYEDALRYISANGDAWSARQAKQALHESGATGEAAAKAT